MPSYTWRCNKCEHLTEVVRKMSEYETPPDGCEKCKEKDLTRVIAGWNKHQTILVHGGRAPWFDEQYFGPRGIPTGK